jgi:hypothetical protein
VSSLLIFRLSYLDHSEGGLPEDPRGLPLQVVDEDDEFGYFVAEFRHD